jgi:prepilin signal peptidase PulO-like enzyme (type II secretory pathway)
VELTGTSSLTAVWSVVAAFLGFALGWLSARLTEWVTPPEEAAPIGGTSMLVRDPLVQAGLAVIWAAIPFVVGGNDVVRWLEGGVLAVPLVQVGVTDLRTRYVYTVVAGIGLLIGLAIGWPFHGADWWWSVVGALGGALAFGLLYALGRLMYRGGEPMARGDVTIAAMVGAGAANQAATALVYGVIASGVLALLVLFVARSRKVYMPYGPGLCLGGLITLLLAR